VRPLQLTPRSAGGRSGPGIPLCRGPLGPCIQSVPLRSLISIPLLACPHGASMALIAIIGTGYVGLTTGACFAHIGHEVICVDIDEAKIAMLKRGPHPHPRRRLENIVREELATGRLRFVTDTPNAVRDREFVYLCVPTPQGPDGSADMSYIGTCRPPDRAAT